MAVSALATFLGQFRDFGQCLAAALIDKLEGQLNRSAQLLFAGIVCLTILGIALYLLVELAERLALPRHVIARDRAAGGTF